VFAAAYFMSGPSRGRYTPHKVFSRAKKHKKPPEEGAWAIQSNKAFFRIPLYNKQLQSDVSPHGDKWFTTKRATNPR
jgi:hypothetical protein